MDTTEKEDYKKFTRVAKYIHRTKSLCLTIKATHLDQHHWYINATFAVRDDTRSHTGAYAVFGKGMGNGLAKRQQINTINSRSQGGWGE